MIDTLRRLNRVVELFQGLGGARRVYRPLPRAECVAEPLGPAEEDVLARCVSGARLGELVDESRFDEEETLTAVRRLLDRGVLEST